MRTNLVLLSTHIVIYTHFNVTGHVELTISIGIAIYPDTIDDINKIVEKADSALYEAKRTGRNKVVFAKL